MLMLSSQKLEVMVLMNLAGNSSTVIGVLSAPAQAPPLLPHKKMERISAERATPQAIQA
jgi:hypothetical protein